MAIFRYQALDRHERLIAGELSADTVADAIVQLESKGLSVQSIGYASESPSGGYRTPHDPSFGESHQQLPHSDQLTDERALLRSHLAAVLQAGAAITPALRAYAEELPPDRRRRQLDLVCGVMERGDVDRAEATFRMLPDYWISLLSAAASSGDPRRVLREFLAESHQADELRRQWWRALAYPLLIGGIAAVVLVALSIVVLPVFRDIYAEFEIALPGLTIAILTLGQWITSPWALVGLLLLLAGGALLIRAQRWSAAESLWRSALARLPYGRSTTMARLARFAADLLDAGLPMTDALRIAAYSTKVTSLRKSAWQIADDIESGRPPGDRGPHSIPRPIAHAVRAEMSTASRIRLLREISACYADRARIGLSWTGGIVEPITICLVGLIVGIMVVALYLPLFDLIHGLSG